VLDAWRCLPLASSAKEAVPKPLAGRRGRGAGFAMARTRGEGGGSPEPTQNALFSEVRLSDKCDTSPCSPTQLHCRPSTCRAKRDREQYPM